MQYAFSLDPNEILGIRADASLQELRDAYREKAKRYHPDRGGDEWAFRMVCKAYEILGTARVARNVNPEAKPSAPAPPPPSPMKPPTASEAASRPERTRAGIRDTVDQPIKLIDVEMFLLRYAITDPMQVLIGSAANRTLSCNLNISWPSKAYKQHLSEDADAQTLAKVHKAFETLPRKTKAIGSHSQEENGEFSGWLSYANESQVKEALQALHKAFQAEGLGIDQWTREMILPRD